MSDKGLRNIQIGLYCVAVISGALLMIVNERWLKLRAGK